MTNEQTSFRSEFRIVPVWVRGLAALVALAGVIGLPIVLQHDPEPPPLWAQMLIAIVVSTIVAALIVLVGYVNRDAGRRGMSRLLWTLLVIFVPNALGFVIYFLMRQPMLAPCPGCGLAVRPDYNFCPRCSHRLAPTCPRCGRGLQPGAQFCIQCGARLQGGPDDPVGVQV